MDNIITLDYGSGGKKTSEFIEKKLIPAFNNDQLNQLSDGAVLNGYEKLVFSTDSFVVSPYFFPGGDIGKLSVCGTINDICMAGGIPKYLSLGLIMEEGVSIKDIDTIIDSIKNTCAECGVKVVTGDTKVVERGKGDGIYINTSGIGMLKAPYFSKELIQEGDSVIVSGNVGDHGTAVMLARNGILSSSNISSDCAPLNKLCEGLFDFGDNIRILRDPTRGGIATTLNEFVEGTEFCIELSENNIPISSGVSAACEILGIDPLYCANEGKLVAVVNNSYKDKVLDFIKSMPEGKNAQIIGTVKRKYPGRVLLKTSIGGRRILNKLTGAQLPRIC